MRRYEHLDPVLFVAARFTVSNVLSNRRQYTQEYARQASNVNLHGTRTFANRIIGVENTSM